MLANQRGQDSLFLARGGFRIWNMPRPPRVDEAGEHYHALNRGNARREIFRKDADFAAFERIVIDALQRFDVELLAYQLMPNHWHMVLRPTIDGEMSRFLKWVTATHTMRYHAHYETSGEGHIYQGRFKSFPIQGDGHFLTVCRYVERNALRANLVSRSEEWQWGSLWRWLQNQESPILSKWPIPRLPRWVERVNEPLTQGELESLRKSANRGRPFGSDEWITKEVKRLGLESTIRPRGRPQVRFDRQASNKES
jgi:putative transposase